MALPGKGAAVPRHACSLQPAPRDRRRAAAAAGACGAPACRMGAITRAYNRAVFPIHPLLV